MDRGGDKRGLTPGQMVSKFHEAFEIPQGHNKEILDLRLNLLLEEVMEATKAAGFEQDDEEGLALKNKPNAEKLLKELCDVVYVAVGWCITHGWDFDDAFCRVHVSNMSKIPLDGKVRRREDGKILKPDSYLEPDLGDLV